LSASDMEEIICCADAEGESISQTGVSGCRGEKYHCQ